jgi:hypothetical protein
MSEPDQLERYIVVNHTKDHDEIEIKSPLYQFKSWIAGRWAGWFNGSPEFNVAIVALTPYRCEEEMFESYRTALRRAPFEGTVVLFLREKPLAMGLVLTTLPDLDTLGSPNPPPWFCPFGPTTPEPQPATIWDRLIQE